MWGLPILLPSRRYLASTDQWVSKLHCLSALQKSYRIPSVQISLSSSASKPGVLLQQQQRGSACMPGTEEKQPKSGALQSVISSNATALVMPSQVLPPPRRSLAKHDLLCRSMLPACCLGSSAQRMRIKRWKVTTVENRVSEPKTALHEPCWFV